MLGMMHIWRPWKLSNFQDPPPPFPSTWKILPFPWPWTSNFKRNLPPFPNDNQSIKKKHNPRKTILCYQVLLSGRAFVFSINSLILSAFPFTSSHLAEASLSAFLWLYTLECAVVQKYHKIFFIYNHSHF